MDQNPTATGATSSIEIPLRRPDLFVVGLLSVVVVGVLIYALFILPETLFWKILGGAAIVYILGINLPSAIVKSRDPSPALIISDAGIFDNSTFPSLGLIPWDDIVEIEENDFTLHRVTKDERLRSLLIRVKNPGEYISRQKSPLKKLQMIIDGFVDSPISIPASALQCDFDQLMATLDQRLHAFKTSV